MPLPSGPGSYAAVAPRLQLDDALLDVATKAGATVLQGHGFAGRIEDRGDHVVLGVEGHGPIAARYVVAADGMWSPLRKAVGGVARLAGPSRALPEFPDAATDDRAHAQSEAGSSWAPCGACRKWCASLVTSM